MGYNKIEKRIYDSAGGGEKGEKAVLNYREYIKSYKHMERQYAKEKKSMLFLSSKNKEDTTLKLTEDEYD